MIINFIFVGVFLNCGILLGLVILTCSLNKKMTDLNEKLNNLKSVENNKSKIKLFEKS